MQHAEQARSILSRHFSAFGHHRRLVVFDTGSQGWEVREEHDSRVVRLVRYTDWHRVERALAAFETDVALFEVRGVPTPDGPS